MRNGEFERGAVLILDELGGGGWVQIIIRRHAPSMTSAVMLDPFPSGSGSEIEDGAGHSGGHQPPLGDSIGLRPDLPVTVGGAA